jgi:hypothetical protein
MSTEMNTLFGLADNVYRVKSAVFCIKDSNTIYWGFLKRMGAPQYRQTMVRGTVWLHFSQMMSAPESVTFMGSGVASWIVSWVMDDQTSQ